MVRDIRNTGIEKELRFQATRSSGPGGQNVNKVNTKVELRFNISESQILTEEEKALVLKTLSNKITLEGDLILTAQMERSQLKNKEAVTERFFRLIEKAMIPPVKRKKTRPGKAAVEKRLEEKKKVSTKKKDRQMPDF